jgi:hypothetical protein
MRLGETDPEIILANEFGPVVKLDGWIQLKMYPEQAALAVGLRSAVESVLVMAATDPSGLEGPAPDANEGTLANSFWEKLMLLRDTLTWACSFSVGRRELPEIDLVRMSR